ncbi:E3 ubiquitin-protein ligase TRIM47 [Ambystoma mexicanum]|uniref:E3 ubiquitin-protein ligase TRIM47 n=1 Tax=Ambystoma mexicanum TaxID=8296 RepID=UPI0037E8C17F
MAAGSTLFAQEYLRCPVCLDIFKHPVTIPCGHSFCLTCIRRCWAQLEAQSACPQCRESFEPTPRLCKNNILAQLAEDFASSEANAPGPRDRPCDFCAGPKIKAAKSCLVCATSYCLQHLRPDSRASAPRSAWFSTRAPCLQHGKPRVLFCRTDQAYICSECGQQEHRGHDTMEAEAGDTEQKMKLLLQRDLESQIQNVEVEIGTIRKHINLIKISTLRDKEEMMRNFTEMMRAIKLSEGKVLQFAESVERTALSQFEGKLNQLGEKKTELWHSRQNMLQSNGADGGGLILQDMKGLMMDVKHDVGRHTWCPEDFPLTHMSQAVAEFKKQLLHLVSDHMESIAQRVSDMPGTFPGTIQGLEHPCLQPMKPRVRAEFLHYAHELTLDQTTAHRNLCLMAGNRKVICKLQPQAYPDCPERFEHFTQVLCQQQFSGGRHYWEVQLSGNRVALGVSYQTIPRKGHQSCCLVGRNAHSWCLEWNSARCSAWHNNQKSLIPKSHHDRLGVFLDYQTGTLSFHEVCDAMPLIHSFQATFSQPLCPIFFISWNSFATIGGDIIVPKPETRQRMFTRQASAEF